MRLKQHFLIIACFFFFWNVLDAAEVKKISTKKSQVYINEGKDTGFKKGVKVCIFNDKNKKIACGKVKAAKSKKAIIRVSKKRIKKIEKGFTVALRSAGNPQDSAKNGSQWLTVRAFYSPALMTPASFNQATYLAPAADAQSVTTLWSNSGTASSALMGFGGEAELEKMGIAAGFRYRQYTSGMSALPIQLTNYDLANANQYVSHSITASSIGFYADYYLLNFSGVEIAAGLDIDMSSVSFSATRMDDSGSSGVIPLYSATSSLNLFSARFPLRYTMALGSLDFFAGLTFLLPLFGSPATSVGAVDDPTNGSKVADPVSDLSLSINHNKSSIGLDFVFGAGMSF